ncbi:MAG: hypothetical protein R3E13_04510 [Alphaproteobacteria bacterium]
MNETAKPLYVLKIEAQLAFNESNIERAKMACTRRGIDTHYPSGEAIDLFIQSNHFGEMSDDRAKFHEMMHIAGLGLSGSHKHELMAAIYEIALLREPFDGNIVHTLGQQRPTHINPLNMISGRRFNLNNHQDFEKPAPPEESSKALTMAHAYIEAANGHLQNKIEVTDQEILQTYEEALQIERFFRAIMGERCVYQLSSNELSDLPLAFFGLIKTGEPQELSFEKIPPETRTAIINDLQGRQQIPYQIENVKTEAELAALTQ